MIESKEDWRAYVRADMEALGAKTRNVLWRADNSMVWLTDSVARWERLLRCLEYWENCRGGRATKPYRVWLRWRFQRLSEHLGFSIPLNVCGPGLCILHYGSIVVSRHARIGARCTLNSCVNIGANPSGGGAALIGDDVYIGPGVKVWNEVRIAGGCTLGANACVSKDVLTPGSVVVGVNRVLDGA